MACGFALFKYESVALFATFLIHKEEYSTLKEAYVIYRAYFASMKTIFVMPRAEIPDQTFSSPQALDGSRKIPIGGLVSAK